MFDTPGQGFGRKDMPHRHEDWFRQAQRDLEQARLSMQAGHHEWACFAAQQAAEKAVKALHLALGQDVWGHVIAKLLQALPESISVPPELIEKARVLDGYYIPPRYPNGHAEGAPFEHYGPLQSHQAVTFAEEIVAFVQAHLPREEK